jgi:hypothetical protein
MNTSPKLTKREHAMLRDADQAFLVDIKIGDSGNMTIARRLVDLGWLSEGASRCFKITMLGRAALTTGTIGTAYPLRTNYHKRFV